MPTLDLDKVAKQKKLVVHASKAQITEIKKLVPSLAASGTVKKKADSIYELFPEHIEIKTPKLLTRPTMGDLSGKTKREESLEDFENSAEFYKKAQTKKGFKIIADEFSDERNTTLYKGFNLIESRWRLFVISQLGTEVIKQSPNPANYQSKTYDHKVSQYVLSEFFEHFLYQPASEDYIRKKWKESDKSEDVVVNLTKLTRIDEFGFPLKVKELTELQQARNTCMHFRVITVQEYSDTVDKVNSYLRVEAQKEFVQAMSISLKPFFEMQESLGRMMSEIIKPQLAMAEMLRNVIPDYSGIFKSALAGLPTSYIGTQNKN